MIYWMLTTTPAVLGSLCKRHWQKDERNGTPEEYESDEVELFRKQPRSLERTRLYGRYQHAPGSWRVHEAELLRLALAPEEREDER